MIHSHNTCVTNATVVSAWWFNVFTCIALFVQNIFNLLLPSLVLVLVKRKALLIQVHWQSEI